jgi:hypothetical protein
MYILSVFSASEMKKPLLKHIAKTQSFQLSLDKPWDTMKAQILAKISAVLDPQQINFSDYEVSFYIAQVFPKPGLLLSTQDDYNVLAG